MAAVACAQAPHRTVTFADLPRPQQREVVQVSMAAAATSALFITLAIVTHPLPSRSFLAAGTVPYFIVSPQPVRVVASAPLRAAVVSPVASDATARRSLGEAGALRVPTVRPQAGVLLASLRESPATSPSAELPNGKRRRNVFSRFFRGVLRGLHPAVKADVS